VARLLDACDRYPDQNAADAVRLLLFTGARLQEALKAEWSQFDLASGVWEKPSSHTKTKRIHRLELAGPSLELVRDMRERSPSGKFLFPGRDACFDPREPDRDLRRARSDLNRPWRHVIAVAGLSDAKRHDLRRTAASFMLDEDVSLTTIGKALGHTQAATTARYAQLRQSAQGAALKKAGDRMVRSRRPPPSARG
jgi:integrase